MFRMLYKDFDIYLIVKSREVIDLNTFIGNELSGIDFLNAFDARRFLEGFLGDFCSMSTLSQILSEDQICCQVFSMNDHQVIDQLVRRLHSGEYKVFKIVSIVDKFLYVWDHKKTAVQEMVAEKSQEGGQEEKKTFYVSIPIDPEDDEVDNYLFILMSDDDGKTYMQTKTVADDKIKGDKRIDLEFTDIVPGVSYSLKLDMGDGWDSFLFEKLSYKELYR